jgi:hypothetical protein
MIELLHNCLIVILFSVLCMIAYVVFNIYTNKRFERGQNRKQD